VEVTVFSKTSVLLYKESFDLLYSLKYAATAICVLILTLTAFINGITSYNEINQNIITGTRAADESLAQEEEYVTAGQKGYQVYVNPTPLAIYDYGVFRSFGFDSIIKKANVAKLSDSPGVGVQGLNSYGIMDPATINNMILSLFAILFSYNLISGERQEGLLRMIFANSISRNQVLFSKIIGGLLPLLLLVVLPMIIGQLVIVMFIESAVSMEMLGQFALLLLVNVLYVIVFFMIGLLISTLTKKPFNSFLFSILLWILVVIIFPRFAINISEITTEMDSPDKVQNELLAYTGDTMKRLGAYYQEYVETHEIKYNQLFSEMTNLVQYAIARAQEETLLFQEKQMQRLQNQRNNFLNRVSIYSFFSPSAIYTSLTQRIVRTHPEFIEKIENHLNRYARSFEQYFESKEEVDAYNPMKMMDRMGVRFSQGAGGKLVITPIPNSERKKLDLSEMPRFEGKLKEMKPDYTMVILEFGALIVMLLILLLASILIFQRYDVR
jgi:ABC-type transport system involved in multi-copper enzyme maturation permease subunit